MEKRLFVKPVDGKIVRKENPEMIISTEGELVPDKSFYRRRIKWGDLVLVTNKTKS